MEYRPSEKTQYQVFCQHHTPLKLKKTIAMKIKKYQKDIINFNKQASQLYKNVVEKVKADEIVGFSCGGGASDKKKPNSGKNYEITHEYDHYYTLNPADEIVIKYSKSKKLSKKQQKKMLLKLERGYKAQRMSKNHSEDNNYNTNGNGNNLRNCGDNNNEDHSQYYGEENSYGISYRSYSKSEDSDSQDYSNFSENGKRKRREEKMLKKKLKKLKEKGSKSHHHHHEAQPKKKFYPKRTGVLAACQDKSNTVAAGKKVPKANIKGLLTEEELDHVTFPYEISNLITLLDPGKITPNSNYHSKFNIFPIGYKCRREYSSYLTP